MTATIINFPTKEMGRDPYAYAFRIWHEAEGWFVDSEGALKNEFCSAFISINEARLTELLPLARAHNEAAAAAAAARGRDFPPETKKFFCPDFTVWWVEGERS